MRFLAVGTLALTLGGGWRVSMADQGPSTPPPDIQTLTVNKDIPGGNVVLDWSDGVAPYSVQRSEAPDFRNPVNLTYVTRNTAGGPISDAVLLDGLNYYYLVSDSQAETEVFAVTSSSGVGLFERETMLVDGVGFASACGDNALYFDDGSAATLSACSPTQLQALIPDHVVSGNVTVIGPSGGSTPTQKLFAIGLRTNSPRTDQTHINVDASHNLFVADQPTTGTVWRIDYTSGASSTCATLGNPVGMPRSGSKLYLGTDTISPNNVGSVRELDVSCSPLVNWGTTGTATSDPVYARALAVDPSGGNPGYVFVLDHAGDRIRRRQNGANLDTMWLTGIGLGGTAPGASDPAGFVFNDAGEFFFTASPNKIRHFSAAKVALQEFTSTDGLSRASQLAFDEGQTLWVANRDANNILRIRTDPMNKLVRTKVSGVTAPRGVALDRDPVTNDPWLYVADQKEVYRFEVYDTVHFDIKVLTDALTSPSGTTTSQAEFEARVRRDANKAAAMFRRCGIDVVVDRVLFTSDPNAGSNGGTGSVLRDGTQNLTSEENALLGNNRSTNNFAVNVYY